MTGRFFLLYRDMPIAELTDRLNDDYYNPIEVLARHVHLYCDHLRTLLPAASLPYIMLCDEFTVACRKYINYRREVFMPYLSELTEKDLSGHDCQNCSGSCDVQHNMKLVEFTVSIKDIDKTLEKTLKMQLHKDAEHVKEFKLLHYKIVFLESIMEEIMCVEEEVLIPKIKEAQKNIHAVS
ncbi:MAG: hypothetical protein P4L41_08350 [Flavipsychrobacter sp.]|nr:hypothetical protein [Flavipsychrobacter sp.]